MKQKYDIFISYRRRDAGDKAEHLKDLLEPYYKKRISFDRENLSGRFNSQLIRRIDAVKDFILVLGKNSFKYTEEDFTPERVRLYDELTGLSEEEFADRIIQVEKETSVDYVRIEIGRALKRKELHIIPVVPERSADYNFSLLELPDDIAAIKGYEAVFYSDSPDALFKDVVPKVRRHLTSKADLIVNKTLFAVISVIAIMVIGIGTTLLINHSRKADAEKKRLAMMETLQEKYAAYGLNFGNNDTIGIPQMAAVADILEGMQEVVPDTLKMGMFEVTNAQWAALMNENCAETDSLLPKTNVSYGDCMQFAEMLYNLTAIPFDLPTEEEWEYAANGGQRPGGTIYSGSDDPSAVAWYSANSGGTKHKCDGELACNNCNLFNMSGNVSEICSSAFYTDAKDDSQLAFRVLRGGDFSSPSQCVRIDARQPIDENDRNNDKAGFRLIIRQNEF